MNLKIFTSKSAEIQQFPCEINFQGEKGRFDICYDRKSWQYSVNVVV